MTAADSASSGDLGRVSDATEPSVQADSSPDSEPGDAHDGDSHTTGTEATWRQIAAGAKHTCALRAGNLWCWGANDAGQIGVQSAGAVVPPTRIGLSTSWTHIAAGALHTCGIDAGMLWCWGANTQGQLGLGDVDARATPERVGQASDWVDVSAGAETTCGLRGNGSLWCWGAGYDRVAPTQTRTPARMGSGENWEALAVGSDHACAVQRPGTLWCWGNNPWGQLGDVDIDPSAIAEPVRVGALGDWRKVAVGGSIYGFTCALRTRGALHCWGYNAGGQTAHPIDGPYKPADAAQVESALDWQHVATADQERGNYGSHGCGIRAGELWCWGYSALGQTGNDDANELAHRVGTTNDWRAVEVAFAHSCGLATDERVSCWGSNAAGQLGVSAVDSSSVPIEVVFP